jgi:hypothetical protein
VRLKAKSHFTGRSESILASSLIATIVARCGRTGSAFGLMFNGRLPGYDQRPYQTVTVFEEIR